MISHYRGMKIVVSEAALEATPEVVRVNFHESRHRSARVLKKLMKRFGRRVEYRMQPCIYRMGSTIIMHPNMYRQFEAALADQRVEIREIG